MAIPDFITLPSQFLPILNYRGCLRVPRVIQSSIDIHSLAERKLLQIISVGFAVWMGSPINFTYCRWPNSLWMVIISVSCWPKLTTVLWDERLHMSLPILNQAVPWNNKSLLARDARIMKIYLFRKLGHGYSDFEINSDLWHTIKNGRPLEKLVSGLLGQ